ncbi:MAG: glycosyltransferase [Candidatus Acidiferrales bacterium]
MPKANAPSNIWIALLGRRDVPADGVTDYCEHLGLALARHGIELRLARVEWSRDSWPRALRTLFRESKTWRGNWVVLQYTALAWSRRGFPVGGLLSLAILRFRGARCAVMLHEPWGTTGPRLIDRIRCAFQNWTVRTLHRFSRKSVVTVPLNTVPWMAGGAEHSAFIPLGANIPENLANRSALLNRNGSQRTVVVFCVSEPPYHQREVADISQAARVAAAGGVRLRVVFVGRGTAEAREEIDRAFQGTPVEACVRGICDAEEVTRIFSESHALIAVRGPFYLRRGSALAGLACGLPIVAYQGADRGAILDEAGIALVPFRDHGALGAALRDILTNPGLWQEMHEKNLRIQRDVFSWNVIAASYADFFAGTQA